jgi:hypothetical protein
VLPIRHLAAIAVTSGVAVASLAAPAVAAKSAAPTTRTPDAAAAGFLARQLAGPNHNHLVDIVGKQAYADDGETADAVLSMDAAGVAQTAAARATKWLEKDVANYAVAYGSKPSSPDYYPGSVAKLLLVADAQHINPENFGGIDLLGKLIGDEGAGGAAPGEFQNAGDTTYGANVITQALAVLALSNTVSGAGPDADAVSFLAGQQCTDGSFQVAIGTCTAANSDVDATAYAAQALIAAGDHSAASQAVGWLVKHERSSGGWGETKGSAADANSTAIAVEALLAAHHGAAAGEHWLLAHQELCGAKPGRRGAVRYQGKYQAATAIRATSQAGAALALTPLTAIDRSGAHAATPILACPANKKR